MSQTTKIQWCDSTVNPTMGCEGCELWTPKVKKCYAGMLHTRFGGVTKGYSPRFEELTFWPGRMAEAAGWSDLTGTKRKDKPWLDGLPRLIFISDMSDALSAAVPFDFLEEQVVRTATSADGHRHQWLWLTKRPERMAEFGAVLKAKNIAWPDNLWAGTSITTQATTARIKHLLRTGGSETIRFLSVEPQQGPVDLSPWLPDLDWVIQGGESGRGASQFQLLWALDMIRQCREGGVPYFLKQLGSVVFSGGRRLAFEDNHAGDWSEWPTEIRVRQMPHTGPAGGPGVSDPAGAVAAAPAPVGPRVPLVVIEPPSNRREAALKAWETRRRKEQAKKRIEAARKAWETRRDNDRKRMRSDAAKQAWQTRRGQ